MTEAYDRILEPAGLTLPQFSLLRRLARHGPLSISELAEIMDLERTTLGRNLKPLKRADLISTGVNEADSRERIVSVTQTGRSAIADATPLWRHAQRNVEKHLGKDQIQLLHELMEKFDEAQFSDESV